MATFQLWDFVVLISILIISSLIGIYYRLSGGQQKTTKEYLMADQSMSALPVSFSLMASFMSAITLLGVSTESYQFGMMFCVINLAYIISTPLAAYLYLPVFYRMRTTSVYEYLERRFGHTTRLIASTAFSVQMILYMGIVLYAPALALEAVTGLNKNIAIFVIGFVCTFYSTIGGMKAVLITDVFQSLLMFAAIYSVIIVSAIKANGFHDIWLLAKHTGRLNFTEISLDFTVRHTWWSLIIGGMITYMSLYAVNQTQVQRLLSVRNLHSAQIALWWNLPILCGLSFSTLFAGLCIFHYYRYCDPVLEGRIISRDQIMPLFAVDTMGKYPGLCGLFVSGIFSASLSTVSSAVSSLAAVTIEDYIKPLYKMLFKRSMLESYTTLTSKSVAFIYGILCIALAFTAASMGGILQASLTIFGVIGGPLLAIFTLGMFTVKANQRGIICGILIGLCLSFIIGFGGPKPPPVMLPIGQDNCDIRNVTKEFSYYPDNMTIAIETTTTTTTTTTGINLSNNIQNTGGQHNMEMKKFSLALASASELKITTTSTFASTPPSYHWLYRLSYLWYSVLGFLTTFITGYIFSFILEYLQLANNSNIYVDSSQKCIDYDLFTPPLSNKLRQQAVHNSLEQSSWLS